jgi:hypothetical protein
MLSLVAFLTSTCGAEDTAAPASTAQQVVQQIVDVQQQMDAQADRLTAIERYLADQILVKEGKAPKGWVQPPIEDYMKPGAPVSLIPVAVPADQGKEEPLPIK